MRRSLAHLPGGGSPPPAPFALTITPPTFTGYGVPATVGVPVIMAFVVQIDAQAGDLKDFSTDSYIARASSGRVVSVQAVAETDLSPILGFAPTGPDGAARTPTAAGRFRMLVTAVFDYPGYAQVTLSANINEPPTILDSVVGVVVLPPPDWLTMSIAAPANPVPLVVGTDTWVSFNVGFDDPYGFLDFVTVDDRYVPTISDAGVGGQIRDVQVVRADGTPVENFTIGIGGVERLPTVAGPFQIRYRVAFTSGGTKTLKLRGTATDTDGVQWTSAEATATIQVVDRAPALTITPTFDPANVQAVTGRKTCLVFDVRIDDPDGALAVMDFTDRYAAFLNFGQDGTLGTLRAVNADGSAVAGFAPAAGGAIERAKTAAGTFKLHVPVTYTSSGVKTMAVSGKILNGSIPVQQPEIPIRITVADPPPPAQLFLRLVRPVDDAGVEREVVVGQVGDSMGVGGTANYRARPYDAAGNYAQLPSGATVRWHVFEKGAEIQTGNGPDLIGVKAPPAGLTRNVMAELVQTDGTISTASYFTIGLATATFGPGSAPAGSGLDWLVATGAKFTAPFSIGAGKAHQRQYAFRLNYDQTKLRITFRGVGESPAGTQIESCNADGTAPANDGNHTYTYRFQAGGDVSGFLDVETVSGTPPAEPTTIRLIGDFGANKQDAKPQAAGVPAYQGFEVFQFVPGYVPQLLCAVVEVRVTAVKTISVVNRLTSLGKSFTPLAADIPDPNWAVEARDTASAPAAPWDTKQAIPTVAVKDQPLELFVAIETPYNVKDVVVKGDHPDFGELTQLNTPTDQTFKGSDKLIHRKYFRSTKKASKVEAKSADVKWTVTQVRMGDDSLANMQGFAGQTTLRTYSILGNMVAPMQPAWLEVMELACFLADGKTSEDDVVRALTIGLHKSTWTAGENWKKVHFLDAEKRKVVYNDSFSQFSRQPLIVVKDADGNDAKTADMRRQIYRLTAFLSAFTANPSADLAVIGSGSEAPAIEIGVTSGVKAPVTIRQMCNSNSVLVVLMARALGVNAEPVFIERAKKQVQLSKDDRLSNVFTMPPTRALIGAGDEWKVDNRLFSYHCIVLPRKSDLQKIQTGLYFDPNVRAQGTGLDPFTDLTIANYLVGGFRVANSPLGVRHFNGGTPEELRLYGSEMLIVRLDETPSMIPRVLVVYDSVEITPE